MCVVVSAESKICNHSLSIRFEKREIAKHSLTSILPDVLKQLVYLSLTNLIHFGKMPFQYLLFAMDNVRLFGYRKYSLSIKEMHYKKSVSLILLIISFLTALEDTLLYGAQGFYFGNKL